VLPLVPTVAAGLDRLGVILGKTVGN